MSDCRPAPNTAPSNNSNITTPSSNPSEIDFSPGIGPSNLWFQPNGTDLQIDLLGTSNSVTVGGFFDPTVRPQVDTFVTNAGLLFDAQLYQLVNAMAAYSSDNPGFNPTTATQMPDDRTLQAVIASAWQPSS